MLAGGTLWVAEEARQVIAFLAATRRGDRLHIDEFDVAQVHQGRGLGRRMLAQVVEWARSNGLTSLSLTTFRDIAWNAPFYASCGFTEWNSDLPADILDALANEALRGLSPRCAMRLAL